MISPFLLRDVLDVAIPEDDDGLLIELVAGMIAISIATGVLGVAQTWLSNLVGQRVMHDLRAPVYRHLQRLSLAFFTSTRTGEIQSRIANDIGGVQTVVTTHRDVDRLQRDDGDRDRRRDAAARLAARAVLARADADLRAAGAAGRQPAAGDHRRPSRARWPTSPRSCRSRCQRLGHPARQDDGPQRRARRPLRARVGQPRRPRGPLAHGRPLDDGLDPDHVRRHAGARLPVRRALRPSAVSIGTLVAFTTLQTRLFFPIQSLLGVGVDIQTSTALFERVFEYLDLDGRDPPGRRARSTTSAARCAFDDVWFRYGERRRVDAARRRHRRSRPGTRTALVGETGSGKTTLGYLAARLYDPERGAVRIDGIDVRELTFDALADAVGVVSQETYLFHASVRENLRFARPDATDEEIEEAARAAQIHDTIAALPDGYDTVVGERGFRFSGGEKQRIAIARTILRNPPVLVLDEATSALDVQTERAVEEALERSPRAARRSSSRTGSRPSATPTRSSCSTAGGSPSAARTTSCWPRGGRYAALVARDEARRSPRERVARRRGPAPAAPERPGAGPGPASGCTADGDAVRRGRLCPGQRTAAAPPTPAAARSGETGPRRRPDQLRLRRGRDTNAAAFMLTAWRVRHLQLPCVVHRDVSRKLGSRRAGRWSRPGSHERRHVPPSTDHAAPVTFEARSEHRNTTTAAISSGSPRRPSGILRRAAPPAPRRG